MNNNTGNQLPETGFKFMDFIVNIINYSYNVLLGASSILFGLFTTREKGKFISDRKVVIQWTNNEVNKSSRL